MALMAGGLRGFFPFLLTAELNFFSVVLGESDDLLGSEQKIEPQLLLSDDSTGIVYGYLWCTTSN